MFIYSLKFWTFKNGIRVFFKVIFINFPGWLNLAILGRFSYKRINAVPEAFPSFSRKLLYFDRYFDLNLIYTLTILN